MIYSSITTLTCYRNILKCQGSFLYYVFDKTECLTLIWN